MSFRAKLGVLLLTGEGQNFAVEWRNTVARIEEGRYSKDAVLDYLQNKDNKALIFTDAHLIYINRDRQRVRWAFSIGNLKTVSVQGTSSNPTPEFHTRHLLMLRNQSQPRA